MRAVKLCMNLARSLSSMLLELRLVVAVAPPGTPTGTIPPSRSTVGPFVPFCQGAKAADVLYRTVPLELFTLMFLTEWA